MSERGVGMAADIAEQPEVYERLLNEQTAAIADVAGRIAANPPRHVVFTARGTSDHAALYGAYLTEIRLEHPGRSGQSPSAVTIYGARPDLSDALVIGVSQSGGSQDLVEVLVLGPMPGRPDARDHQQPGIAAGRGRRTAHRRRRRA